MINLRYHVISIVAVFLALAIGIAMGATVVDRGLVQIQEQRLDDLDRRLQQRRDEVEALRSELRGWDRFTDQAVDQLLIGRLRDVPVLVLTVAGVAGGALDALDRQLDIAQAARAGRIVLSRKLGVHSEEEIEQLAAAAGVAPGRAADVRAAALQRLATSFASGPAAGPSPLLAMRDAGFVEYEPAPGSTVPIEQLPVQQTRFVVVSGAGAALSDALVLPFVEALAAPGTASILVAEVARDDAADRAVFVGLLRNRSDMAGKLSTVDNLDTYVGRVAAVLALEDLASATTGHFGAGPGASRLLPAPNA